jgi:hypothetical protein
MLEQALVQIIKVKNQVAQQLQVQVVLQVAEAEVTQEVQSCYVLYVYNGLGSVKKISFNLILELT